jgi:hypothetical protein
MISKKKSYIYNSDAEISYPSLIFSVITSMYPPVKKAGLLFNAFYSLNGMIII